MTFHAAVSFSLFLCGCAATPPKEPESVSSSATTVPVIVTQSSEPEATASADVSSALRDALAAGDRLPADRELDAGRKPGEVLSFFGIAPGMRVAEIGAGGGYTTEILARVVGEKGKVYGQNSRFILERFADKPWTERLARPVNAKVVRVDRDFDDPLPEDAKNLDAVLCILFYHDTVWLGTKRDAMNKAIFAALRSGGVYGIVDHSARAGSGLTEVQTLHRIEEKNVIEEVERAGFRLAKKSDVLSNPKDPRDWNDSPKAAGDRRGTSDRFVLRFEKP